MNAQIFVIRAPGLAVLLAAAACSPKQVVTAPVQAVGSVARAAAPVAAGTAVGGATANPAASVAAGRATQGAVARPPAGSAETLPATPEAAPQ